MKNPKFLLVVFLLVVAAATPIPHAYSSALTVTVFTDKPSYLIAESITVSGNLTYDGSPVPNWPVALEVQDPTGTPVVTRTPQTDTNGTYNLTFKLPANAELGTYTVYVSSGYKGETATDDTTFEIIPIRDIAVTNATSSKTVVGQGYSMNITVAVGNQGEPTETFNLTVYCNETAITLPNEENYTTVTLPSGNSTTITLLWNCTGFARGNYTIWAYAWPVPDETNTDNNNCTGSWVVVAGVGDLTGGTPNAWDFVPDGKVDIVDVATVAKCFGQKVPPAPGNCDVSGSTIGVGDGKIDITDVATVARRFGQHYP